MMVRNRTVPPTQASERQKRWAAGMAIKLPFERRDEIENPVPFFQKLLTGSEEGYRHDLRATEWFDEKTLDEAGQLWEEFRRDFNSLVKKLSKAIREPDFNGSNEDRGYPDELEWAPHLAYWLFDDRAVFVICEWQDKETPMILGLGVKPRREFTPRTDALCF